MHRRPTRLTAANTSWRPRETRSMRLLCIDRTIAITAMMASSPPLNIVQSREEILIGAEANRGRFIYTDGRGHPDIRSADYVSSGFGHSIGHWEGDTLVIDTIGFPARVCDSRRPAIVTPGGGRAKETTHLVERFRLTEGGDVLSVTFTWEDPTVFTAPHTYSYTYKKLAGTQPIQRRQDDEAIRWCINVGVPALMGDRAPLDIRQSATVTAVVAKSPSSVRYIYTDGRHHPDKDDLEPTTNGHSIGQWEGDTFV